MEQIIKFKQCLLAVIRLSLPYHRGPIRVLLGPWEIDSERLLPLNRTPNSIEAISK